MKKIFYKADDGYCADFIPFYKDGVYYLFYLHDYRDSKNHGEGTPWYLITTADFVNFKEYGQVLPRGGMDEQDLYVFTGSAFEGNGKYHIYYTGHNHHLKENGMAQEAVMHAVSDDLIHWEKAPGEKLFAPDDRYEPDDWRDPFIFKDAETGGYRMIMAARLKDGPPRRRGVTAMMTSDDLRQWRPAGELYAPGLYVTHECPDYFKWGDWYYLIFSEFSGEFRTHYRMSRQPLGPWTTPKDDVFDTRAYYAAKTAGNENERYLFGWNPSKNGNKDSGGWQWGSDLVVHKLRQEADGRLTVCCPEAVKNYYANKHELNSGSAFGKVSAQQGKTVLDASGHYACCLCGSMPESCKIEAEGVYSGDMRSFGLMLRASPDMEKAYYIRYDAIAGRLVFDLWPRPAQDRDFQVETERPYTIKPGKTFRFTVFADKSLLLCYLNDELALSARMYDLPDNGIGLFANGGRLEISKLELFD